MTFDLTPEQQAVREAAAAFARERLQGAAAEIDRVGEVPAVLARDATALVDRSADRLALALVIEEIAAASAAVAMMAGAGGGGAATLGLAGLRGGAALPETPRSHLVLAGIALGLGRAGLETALAELRRSPSHPDTGVERPHWLIADTATDLEAARLATWKAALAGAGDEQASIALARLLASQAARRAVEAAIRVEGRTALKPGSLLERLLRDVHAVALLLGTEDDQRAAAAEGLLPPT
jgi:alkylation response protein AidB-like acyl-CoA dehydrogenase